MPRAISDEQLLYMYAKPGKGYTDAELAEYFGVGRDAIFKRRKRFRDEHYIDFIETERGRYRIDNKTFLSNLRVSRSEALALYVAARRLSRSTRLSRKVVQSALDKLALALYQPMTEKLVKAAAQSPEHPDAARQESIVAELLRGWMEGIKVRIRYRGLKGTQNLTHIIEPYLIEPSPWSDSVYVIAYSNVLEKVSAFKLERIQRALLTTERYTVDANFSDETLFEYSWGIWNTDAEPQPVRLRFTDSVAIRRVQESIWHPHQTIESQADGTLIWQAPVAEPREMIPWIRGWGSAVTVLSPDWLREWLRRDVEKMAKLYGVKTETENNLIAHRRKKDETEQLLITHLTETAQWAEQFAAKIGLSSVGRIMGLLHDFGKASQEYQNYVRSAEGLINPDEEDYVDYKAKKGKIDHSTAGAQLIWEKLAERGREGKLLAQFLALAIASHHSGLIDCLKPSGENEFNRRITKDDKNTHLAEARCKLPDIEKQLNKILDQPIEQQFFTETVQGMKESGDSAETLWFKLGLLARYLLSCLLDADRLNTADFENPGNESIRNYGKYVPWKTLIDRLERKFDEFARHTAGMKPGRALEVNELRAQVAQDCLNAACKPKGIYRLTVPTGGGKTLASLRFALHHAKIHNMDRVFYIVPYITIIDQNAQEVRQILEDVDENKKPLGKIVLEHHSNFVPPNDTRHRHDLLAENWDAPIVFTTQVQFLEALFSAGTRDARRMHQLANSVIIFDEVQTMPIKITHMFTVALRFLTHNCGATALLCTATQPPLDKLPNTYRSLTIEPDQEITKDKPALFAKLKRVEVFDERKPGGMTNAEIADLAERALDEKGSVLIIVNTRAMARALYEKIKNRKLTDVYHLSTNMCPKHRMDKLDEIKAKLAAHQPVICVSTQLIEAGVDIDFGAVIRSLAGLDSIAQAAGRCNRHGEREELGSVWVVNPKEENLSPLPDIREGREIGGSVLRAYQRNPNRFDNDRIGIKSVAKYYNNYFQRKKSEFEYPVGTKDGLEENNSLFEMLARNRRARGDYANKLELRQSFKTASKIFQVIDKPTTGVIIPYENGKEIITNLCGDVDIRQMRKLLKQAQQYSINLYQDQFKNLKEAGAIYEITMNEKTITYYLDSRHYSNEFGWSFDVVGKQEFICF